MKSLNWLLYQVHRWVGLVLGLFMFFWFFTGLVIMYSTPTTQSRSQQLAHAETLAPELNWLSLGDVWTRHTEIIKAATEKTTKPNKEAKDKPGTTEAKKPEVGIAEARLVRTAGEPQWIVEDTQGKFMALSALDGSVRKTSVDQALQIARNWYASQGHFNVNTHFIETVENPIILRNQDALKPFHHIAVGDDGDELMISERTGKVLHASTQLDRAFYWAGNWLHLLKPLEAIALGKIRNDVQLYLGLFATLATLTGIIIGWLRWRPGFGGKPTYSQGRTQPYREFWFKWHFWSGLIGGIVVLFWAFSGFIDTNPGKIFSAANPTKDELARFAGKDTPDIIRNWQPILPAILNVAVDGADVVELSWRHLNNEALLLASTRDGQRLPQDLNGATLSTRFSDTSLLEAIGRATKNAPIESQTVLNEYDSYYYPRHHQNLIEKPLPVLQVKLADEAGTYFYLDPQDGRVLAKVDRSRRVFRWLYSALHHWDFGWVYQRPLWDFWMLTWVLLGLVLGTTSLVMGWKLLKKTFAPKKKRVQRRNSRSIHKLDPEINA
ncbi:MAG: PepSY domain-containing protein [Methylococcales bacterium]